MEIASTYTIQSLALLLLTYGGYFLCDQIHIEKIEKIVL